MEEMKGSKAQQKEMIVRILTNIFFFGVPSKKVQCMVFLVVNCFLELGFWETVVVGSLSCSLLSFYGCDFAISCDF